MSREEQIEKLLRKFYREHLVRVAEAARERGIDLLAPAGAVGDDSYFEDRVGPENYVSELLEEEFPALLKEMWTAAALPELAELSEQIISIAEEIREEDDDGEVSSLIYAMY